MAVSGIIVEKLSRVSSGSDARNIALYIKENFFKKSFRSDSNWRFAFQTLLELADTYPSEVREALRYRPSSEVSPLSLNRYSRLTGDQIGHGRAESIRTSIEKSIARLKANNKQKITVFSATYRGGGVSEMLSSICTLISDAGIEVEWHIIYPLNTEFYQATKLIHNLIQGKPGSIGSRLLKCFDETNRLNARLYRSIVQDNSVGCVFLEDPQVMPMIKYLSSFRGRLPLCWRLHIATDGIRLGCKGAEALTEYLRLEYLDFLSVSDVIICQPYSVPEFTERLPVTLKEMASGIDICSSANIKLSWEETIQEIESINKTMRKYYSEPETLPVNESWTDINPNTSTWVTGARFDHWKGLNVVLNAFSGIEGELSDTDLVIFGNFADDDPEGTSCFKQLCTMLSSVEESVRRRVHLVANPSRKSIRALYRLAAKHKMPFIAYSLREGYNIMADEASIQGAAVLTTDSGGLKRFSDDNSAYCVPISDIDIGDPAKLYDFPGNPVSEELERRLQKTMLDLHLLRSGEITKYIETYRILNKRAIVKVYETSVFSMTSEYLGIASGLWKDGFEDKMRSSEIQNISISENIIKWREFFENRYSSEYVYKGIKSDFLVELQDKGKRARELDALRSFLPETHNGLIMDYGCGCGETSEIFKKAYTNNAPVVINVDPDRDRLHIAEKKCAELGLDSICINANFDNIRDDLYRLEKTL